MELGGLLGGLDTSKINDMVKFASDNKELIKQISKLPDLCVTIGEALQKAGTQAATAGEALLGTAGDDGMTHLLAGGSEALSEIAGSISGGVDRLGEVSAAIGKLSVLDGPAKALASAVEEIGSTSGQLEALSSSMAQIAGLMETVGTALVELGAHLGESGGDVKGFLAAP